MNLSKRVQQYGDRNHHRLRTGRTAAAKVSSKSLHAGENGSDHHPHQHQRPLGRHYNRRSSAGDSPGKLFTWCWRQRHSRLCCFIRHRETTRFRRTVRAEQVVGRSDSIPKYRSTKCPISCRNMIRRCASRLKAMANRTESTGRFTSTESICCTTTTPNEPGRGNGTRSPLAIASLPFPNMRNPSGNILRCKPPQHWPCSACYPFTGPQAQRATSNRTSIRVR